MLEVQATVTACGDCGGSLVDYDDYSACEFVESVEVDSSGVIECGYSEPVGGEVCKDGLPVEWCARCQGRPSAWVRSQVTGKVTYSPDLVSWFVPSALGHEGSAGRGWANFVGVEQGSGALSDSVGGHPVDYAPEGLGDLDGYRRYELDAVGEPEWYSEGSGTGVTSRSDAAAREGLDWYGLSDLYAADLLASLLPVGVVEPVPAVRGVDSAEASTMYGGAVLASAWDDGERLREWRQVTGRTNGGAAGMGRGWAS